MIDSVPSSVSWQKLVSSKASYRALGQLLMPKLTPYIPHSPTAKQQAFLLLPHREAFYGGAAAGGKSDALLMAALQYVDVPGYSALLLRRTYPQLKMNEGLLQRAHEWLRGTDARWDGQNHTYHFPAGAVVTFGHMSNPKDIARYDGTAWTFVGYDEVTHFLKEMYTYLFSRQRRLRTVDVPVRMRAASNPGNIGHEWVRQRFLIEGTAKGRPFIPAALEDNPYVDQQEYERNLMELEPLLYKRLRAGDWSAAAPGSFFAREGFKVLEARPAGGRWVRYWDMAATEAKEANGVQGSTDPDWTAGALVGIVEERVVIADLQRFRLGPAGVEQRIMQQAGLDGRAVPVHIEQEPGSSGKTVVQHFIKKLMGWAVSGQPVTGSKTERAKPLAGQVMGGNVSVVRGPWVTDFLDEAEAFPFGSHDDQVDAVAGGFTVLTERAEVKVWRA